MRVAPCLASSTCEGGLHGEADPFCLHPQQQRRAFKYLIHHTGEAVGDRDDEGQGIDRAGHALAAGVVQLDAQLRAVAVDTLGKFAHRLDVIVMAHRQLREGGRAAHVVDAADAGDDHAHAALRALLVIVHQALGGLAVGLAQRKFRRRHDGAVLDGHAADLHRREQKIIHFKPFLLAFLYKITILPPSIAVKFFAEEMKT